MQCNKIAEAIVHATMTALTEIGIDTIKKGPFFGIGEDRVDQQVLASLSRKFPDHTFHAVRVFNANEATARLLGENE